MLLILLLLAAFPYVAALPPFRDAILRAVLPEVEGTVTAGGASLGWFSPITFQDVEISAPDGTPVVTVPKCQGDRPLWRYLTGPSELGNFRVERPRLNVAVTEEGSNLRQVFAVPTDEPQQPAALPDVSVGLEIVDASLSFRSRDATRPWNVEGFNLSAMLRPSTATESGLTELALHQGTVFQNTPLTPQMCDDLLKYIAPVLAEVTDVSGEFSIQLDNWRSPAADLGQVKGSGRLVIHSIDLSAGPLVRGLAPLLKLPPSVRLADESVIRFEVADGRVHHRDLEFGVRGLTIRTQGSVGFDQSLDLAAEVPLPTELLEGVPLPESLRTQPIKLPICGTLNRPQIDPKALGTANVDLLMKTLGELLNERTPDGNGLLDRLLDPNRRRETPQFPRLRERQENRDGR